MSEHINELAKALSIAQGQMENAKKDSSNPFFKSSYADLASIITAAKKPLSENGLSIVQVIEPKTDEAILTTMLMHNSGQWIKSTVAIKPKDTTAQSMGSAITYARRYGYQAIVGLSAEDDDGNGAPRGNRGQSATLKDHGCTCGTTGQYHAVSCPARKGVQS